MPSAAFHSNYWAGSADADAGGGGNPSAGASSAGGYVPWQTSVIVGSGFGVTQVVWEWLSGYVSETRSKQRVTHGND